MSKERARAREARLEARRREVEAAAQRRAKQERRAAARERLTPTLPRRTKRFGMLTTRELVQVVVAYLGVQALLWLFVEDARTRFALAVVSLGFTLVLVRTRKRTSR